MDLKVRSPFVLNKKNRKFTSNILKLTGERGFVGDRGLPGPSIEIKGEKGEPGLNGIVGMPGLIGEPGRLGEPGLEGVKVYHKINFLTKMRF